MIVGKEGVWILWLVFVEFVMEMMVGCGEIDYLINMFFINKKVNEFCFNIVFFLIVFECVFVYKYVFILLVCSVSMFFVICV